MLHAGINDLTVEERLAYEALSDQWTSPRGLWEKSLRGKCAMLRIASALESLAEAGLIERHATPLGVTKWVGRHFQLLRYRRFAPVLAP